jgi:hypothetical protein
MVGVFYCPFFNFYVFIYTNLKTIKVMNEKQYDFPTEVLDLPSEGKVYSKDNPLSSGRITIKLMTAKEEDILSSTNLIKKGVVLDKLFESIIVDKVNPNDIIIGDKNAILLATRVLGYGPDYNFSFYSNKKGNSVEVNADLTQVKTKEIDLSLFDNKNEIEYITPYGKNKILFKLLTHGDEREIEREIDALKKLNKDLSSDVTTRLRYMIKSVDGNSEVGTIARFVNNMRAMDSRAFREYVKKVSPDMDMTIQYTHEDGEVEEAPISLGVNFFWPTNES